jgi:C1A family cysteine protease
MSSRIYLTKEQKAARRAYRSKLPVHPRLNTPIPSTRPVQFDLKAKCPFIYDQGDIGSCTANAICMALVMLEKDKAFLPSRLYLYYKERLMELQAGDKISDSGADAADGLSVLVSTGVCPEASWPYITTNCDVPPPLSCDVDALQHKVHEIGTVAADDVTGTALIDAICHSIQLGIPVLIGIDVYDSFDTDESAKTGNVPLPLPTEQNQGGHEILIVGYDDKRQRFILVNSWGPDWGWKGFFNLPYAYITDPKLTSEFICISKV